MPNLYNDPFCPYNSMEVTVVNKTKNELEFEIHGAIIASELNLVTSISKNPHIEYFH